MAKKMFYETGKAPQIVIEAVHGDLTVRAWQENRVAISGEFDAEETADGIQISRAESVSMRLPEAASLTVRLASGDAGIRGVAGVLDLGAVHGDLVIKNAGEVRLERVSGDLALVNLSGGATIGEVMGDASMRRVQSIRINAIHGDLAGRFVDGTVDVAQANGDVSFSTVSDDLSIERCQRDANLRNLGGINVVQQAYGDIRLRGGLLSGKHSFKAQGDIVVRWPTNAPLALTAKSASVLNRLPLEDESSESGVLTGRIGDGGTVLNLEAVGRIVLKELDADPSQEWGDVETDFAGFGADMAAFGVEVAGLSERIAGEIETHMSQLSARLETKFGPDFAQKMAEKAALRAEKAVERVARHAEQARSRAARYESWNSAPPTAPKRRPTASAEEQRKVLEMLEKGLISVEEANTLLKAMGG